jgi:signal transduction histidine kinase
VRTESSELLAVANGVALALASSLELDEAFQEFISELTTSLPFDRAAIILDEGEGIGRVAAAAGVGAGGNFAPGRRMELAGTSLEAALVAGKTTYTADLLVDGTDRQGQLAAELGLRCRIIVPLLAGADPVGTLSLWRKDPSAFRDDELELATLLGRLAGSAVQNIRAYEAERSRVEELRRLSELRDDIVSLVSHELRSPTAAVLGAAETLRQRWPELSGEQRDALLDVVAEESKRLGVLVGDVLDASRIDSGTFSYSFGDVDVAEIVREAVAAAALAHASARISAEIPADVPSVRADRERLRQVLTNLVENAVKYSDEGTVCATVFSSDGHVRIDVADDGPGIAPEHHELIFQKFGRVAGDGPSRPGSGLGLFIARSIAEAHGGTIQVRSEAGAGSTFSLVLPVAEL